MQHKVEWLKSSIKEYSKIICIMLYAVSSHSMQQPELSDPTFNDLALMEHITQKNVEGVRAALMQPVHINIRCEHYARHTPLSEAVATDNLEIVDLVLAHPELDVDADAGNGYRALHIAAMQGQDAMVRKLCAAGASLSVIHEDGNTPFHEAVQYKKPIACQILISTVATKKIACVVTVRKELFPFLCCCWKHKQGGLKGVLGILPRDIQLLICDYIMRASVDPELHDFVRAMRNSKGLFTFLVDDQFARVKSALNIKNNHGWTAPQKIVHNEPEAISLLSLADEVGFRAAILSYVQEKYKELSLTSIRHNSGTQLRQPKEDKE